MPLKEVRLTDKDIRKLFRTDTTATKAWRAVRRGGLQLFSLLIVFAFFFVAINSPAYYQRLRYALAEEPTLPPEPQPQPAPEPEPEPIVTYPPEIIIPKIGVTAPLNMNVLPSQVLPTLQNGVVHYADTALPGQIGNVVIFGHSSDFPWSPGAYKNVFALLDRLAPGDQIIVPYGTQRFGYVVISSQVVRATELSVLKKTPTPQLTLITCYPVGTAQRRLVIVARLTTGTVTGEQVVEPLIEELPKVR